MVLLTCWQSIFFEECSSKRVPKWLRTNCLGSKSTLLEEANCVSDWNSLRDSCRIPINTWRIPMNSWRFHLISWGILMLTYLENLGEFILYHPIYVNLWKQVLKEFLKNFSTIPQELFKNSSKIPQEFLENLSKITQKFLKNDSGQIALVANQLY